MEFYPSSDEIKKAAFISTSTDLLKALQQIIPPSLSYQDVMFLCIGTEKVRGDTFGPLLGTFLQRHGYRNVLGTIQYPVHAMNLKQVLVQIPPSKTVIAIDACIGAFSSLETFTIFKGSLQPGAGVGKTLPFVGDYSIMGMVEATAWRGFEALKLTDMARVVTMAQILSIALMKRFPLPSSLFFNAFREDAALRSFVYEYHDSRILTKFYNS